ncbi:MAG TPA: acyl transferase [Acidobacteria bacterium]|nr:acyl transferase [Acidobacteriota bacterium]|tara:strand:+ start:1043 stop:1744 length:702 start_codon:yes stop_codon:yes gene_type:complete
MTLNTPLELSLLTQWDTPTICNALELIVPERRGYGFTVEHAVCLDPTLKPIVGYARTARCASRTQPEENAQTLAERRLAYYEYVAGAPQPTIAVIQDFETNPGAGAFWGEVQTNIHKGLGCLGAVTNSAMRDLDDCAPGFQILARKVVPSHIFNHVIDFETQVEVFGMVVKHNDIIHADRHGAVVIPNDAVDKLPAAVDLMIRKEAVQLDAARDPSFNIEMLRAALTESAQVK